MSENLKSSSAPHDPRFRAEVLTRDDEVVVAVAGEIDMAAAPKLWEKLAEAIPAVKHRLVVDLSRATFIDSTGLAVLARVLKRVRRQQADLVLRAPNKSARKVLRITGLDKVMTIDSDAAESSPCQ